MSKQLDIEFPEGNSLPDGWSLARVGEVARLQVGFAFKSKQFVDEGVRLLRGDNIEPGSLRWRGVRCWPDDDVEQHRHLLVEPGDVILAMDRPVISSGLKIAQVLASDTPALLVQRVARLQSLLGENSYLRYALERPAFIKHISDGQTGTMLPHISGKTINAFVVPVAPLPEQRRIVAEIETQFTRLDAAVSTLERVQANLKRARASVLKAAVEGRLVPTEAEVARAEGRAYEPASVLLERILEERRRKHDEAQVGAKRKKKYKPPVEPETEGLPELPEGWVWTALGQAFSVHVGATPSRKAPEYWGGDIAWVSSGEVQFCRIKETRETITEEGLANTSTSVHPAGTVLMGMIGQGRTRGQTAIVDIPACNNQNAAAIRVSETAISPEYVYYYLMGRYEQTRRLGSGNNQKALNKSRVQAIEMPLPPLAEQTRILAEVERRLSVVDALEQTVERDLRRCTALRQSILKRAFEGKLVPQEPNDEPASELLARIGAAS